MKSKGTLRLGFGGAAEAQRLADALAPENAHYLLARVEGSVLVLDASAEAPMSLLHTLDDALACL
ncbi:MAG: hypothetical protein WDA16_08180, partial [Candidatus Thermoplasmatota archaeon]